MGSYSQDFEDRVGNNVSDYIIKAVREGQFSISEVEQFTRHLHQEVWAKFITAKAKNDFEFGPQSVQIMLSDWYEKVGHVLTKEEAIEQLVTALNKAGKYKIASDLRKTLKNESEEGVQDKTNTKSTENENEQLLSGNKNLLQDQNQVEEVISKSSKCKYISRKLIIALSLSLLIVLLILGLFIYLSKNNINNNNIVINQNQAYHSRLTDVSNLIDDTGKETVITSTARSMSKQFVFQGNPLTIAQTDDTQNAYKSGVSNETRTIIFEKSGKIKELHKCLSNQSIIPDIPMDSTLGSVGIYINKEHGILVCGGLQINPKLCYGFKLESAVWKKFPHELNTNRLQSYIMRSGNRIFIIGGRSSDVNQECYPSQEVLDLDKMGVGKYGGWRQEEIEGAGNLCREMVQLVIDIPCI